MTSYVHFVHRNSHRNSTIQHIGIPRLTSQVQKIPWQTSQVDFSQILCLSVKKQEFFRNSEVEFLCRFCTQEVIDVRTHCGMVFFCFTVQCCERQMNLCTSRESLLWRLCLNDLKLFLCHGMTKIQLHTKFELIWFSSFGEKPQKPPILGGFLKR